MLDRTRQYGTILGLLEDCPEARYEQDGKLFDVDGKPCGEVLMCDICGFIAKSEHGLKVHAKKHLQTGERKE